MQQRERLPRGLRHRRERGVGGLPERRRLRGARQQQRRPRRLGRAHEHAAVGREVREAHRDRAAQRAEVQRHIGAAARSLIFLGFLIVAVGVVLGISNARTGASAPTERGTSKVEG